MRLKKSRAAADEELLRLVNDGYGFLQETEHDFETRVPSGVDEQAETARAEQRFQLWTKRVVGALQDIFPTEREAYLFVRSHSGAPSARVDGVFDRFWGQMIRIEQFVQRLDALRLNVLGQYTDLPITARLYIEDIDSFAKVRDVNHGAVADVLKDGRVELGEDAVQLALEHILNVSFHRRDWGGETNDLHTPNVIVNGARTATAFALKGNGCKARELRIRDCGKNGDQLVRLMESPAALFIVQYIGPISDAVIKDLEGKVEERRATGRQAWFCMIDGQDTARLLKAYGKLPPNLSAGRSKSGRARRRK